MGERTKLFGDRGEQMRRGSIVQARTDVQHFHYLGEMHNGDRKKQGVSHGRITAERRAPGPGHLSANFSSMRLDCWECHQKRKSKRRGLWEISPQLLLIRVNSDKLVRFISLWRLQERQMQEAEVYFKARLLLHFQTLSGWNYPAWQWHLHNLGKTCTTWHPCLETFSVSQEKSSLAPAGTANLLKLCLFDLRESCWRFWAKLTWGSCNTEAAKGSRLPWGTNQPRFYIACARALENETCSCSCLHQGKVTAGREKSQIPTSCQLWDEGSLALQRPFSCTVTSACSLFCVKGAMALKPAHHCIFTGRAEFKFSFATEMHSPVLVQSSLMCQYVPKDHRWSRATEMLHLDSFYPLGLLMGRNCRQTDRIFFY